MCKQTGHIYSCNTHESLRLYLSSANSKDTKWLCTLSPKLFKVSAASPGLWWPTFQRGKFHWDQRKRCCIKRCPHWNRILERRLLRWISHCQRNLVGGDRSGTTVFCVRGTLKPWIGMIIPSMKIMILGMVYGRVSVQCRTTKTAGPLQVNSPSWRVSAAQGTPHAVLIRHLVGSVFSLQLTVLAAVCSTFLPCFFALSVSVLDRLRWLCSWTFWIQHVYKGEL